MCYCEVFICNKMVHLMILNSPMHQPQQPHRKVLYPTINNKMCYCETFICNKGYYEAFICYFIGKSVKKTLFFVYPTINNEDELKIERW